MWWHPKKKNLKIIDTLHESYMMGCWMSRISIIFYWLREILIENFCESVPVELLRCWVNLQMKSLSCFHLPFGGSIVNNDEITILLLSVWWSHIPMFCLIHDCYNFPCLISSTIYWFGLLDHSKIESITKYYSSVKWITIQNLTQNVKVQGAIALNRIVPSQL